MNKIGHTDYFGFKNNDSLVNGNILMVTFLCFRKELAKRLS